MMPKFLLAKYVPNLARMEPRNIGLFLWANGDIESRFLSREEATFIADKDGYDLWVRQWKEMLASGSVSPKRGRPVSKEDPACLDAILTRQEDAFILVNAGDLLEKITRRDMQAAIDYLFSELVAVQRSLDSGPGQRSQSLHLGEVCKKLFIATGLAARQDYQEDYSIPCPIYGVTKHLKFSHGLGNGHPDSVFQQANLRNQQSVNSTALMLHSIIYSTTLPMNRCAALARKEDVTNAATEEGLALLRAVCRVIYVDTKDAGDEIREVALNGQAALTAAAHAAAAAANSSSWLAVPAGISDSLQVQSLRRT